MLRHLARRGVTASRAAFRVDDVRTRTVASSSPASLNEDDKDGGKTIEIIESNLVRPFVRRVASRRVAPSCRRHLHRSARITDAHIVFTVARRIANAVND